MRKRERETFSHSDTKRKILTKNLVRQRVKINIYKLTNKQTEKDNRINVTTYPTEIAKATTPLQEQQKQLIKKRGKINCNKADSISRGSMLTAVIGLNR